MLNQRAMKFICRHCDEITTGRPYRVVSQEDGVILLNMVVCHACNKQARALGLRSKEINLDPKPRKHRRSLDYTGAATAGR